MDYLRLTTTLALLASSCTGSGLDQSFADLPSIVPIVFVHSASPNDPSPLTQRPCASRDLCSEVVAPVLIDAENEDGALPSPVRAFFARQLRTENNPSFFGFAPRFAAPTVVEGEELERTELVAEIRSMLGVEGDAQLLIIAEAARFSPGPGGDNAVFLEVPEDLAAECDNHRDPCAPWVGRAIHMTGRALGLGVLGNSSDEHIMVDFPDRRVFGLYQRMSLPEQQREALLAGPAGEVQSDYLEGIGPLASGFEGCTADSDCHGACRCQTPADPSTSVCVDSASDASPCEALPTSHFCWDPDGPGPLSRHDMCASKRCCPDYGAHSPNLGRVPHPYDRVRENGVCFDYNPPTRSNPPPDGESGDEPFSCELRHEPGNQEFCYVDSDCASENCGCVEEDPNVRRCRPADQETVACRTTCYSHTLDEDVSDGDCVQAEHDCRWYRCDGDDRWQRLPSSVADHPGGRQAACHYDTDGDSERNSAGWITVPDDDDLPGEHFPLADCQ